MSPVEAAAAGPDAQRARNGPAGGGRRPRARAGGRGDGRHSRPPLGRRRGRGRPRPPAPPGHLHHQLGQLPLSEEEDRSDPPDGHRPGHPPRPQPGGQQPGVGRGVPCRGCGTAWAPGTAPGSFEPVDRVWPRRPSRAAAGSCSPRGWPASAPPSTIAGPGPASTTSRCGRHGPRWSGPCWRGWPSTPGGCPRPSSASPGSRFGSIRAIGGGATSALWCSIYRRCPRPDHRTGGRAGARQPPGQRPAGRGGARPGGAGRAPLAGARGRHPPPAAVVPYGATTACSQSSPRSTPRRRACSSGSIGRP